MHLRPSRFFLALACLTSTAGHCLEARDVFKQAEPSVVVVLASDAKGEKNGLGSGVLIAPLEIVTSCKVLDSAADIVISQGAALRKAKLRFSDTERDVCQLHIDEPFPSGLAAAMPVTATEAEAGQELYAIGSPRGMERTISHTMVSGMRDVSSSKFRLIQIDALLPGGMTGGGIFDQDAKLVGIIVAQFRQVENSSYAAPSRWFADLSNRGVDQIAAAMAIPQRAQETTQASANVDALTASSPRVGDFWKYRVTFGRREVGTAKVEIVEMRGKVARERVTYDQSKGFIKERIIEVGFNPTRFQPVAVLPGGYQLTDLAPYAEPDTPFKAGQRWHNVAGEFAPQGGSNTQSAMSEVWVAGMESVRVPAGQFKAWKIETTSERLYVVNSFAVVKCTYWYAPEVKRTVKMNLAIKSSTEAYSSNEAYELVSFEQGK